MIDRAVSDSVADILQAAYYYRLVDGHTVIDPALVLVAASRNDKTLAQPLLGTAVAQALPLLAADASAGAPHIGVAALLLGLLDSAHPAVHTLAETANLDIAATTSALRKQRPWAPEEPYTPLTGLLTVAGITDQRIPLLIRGIPALMRGLSTRREGSGPILIALEQEILRQAVITGHPSVQTAHLPLAIVSMQEQLTTIGSGLAAPLRQHNQGALLLARQGFDLRAAQQSAESLPHDDEVLTPSDVQRRLGFTGKIGDPSWTRPAATAMEHAAATARRRQHRYIGTTHLLAAALTDADSTASRLLETLGIDTASLRAGLDHQLETPS